ncbi:MAG: Crp/Fnr family transcriptional regulator [Gammaproteobacteria bacterium]|nr:Crp/Fnr family transcriptional regulator [Gammaproteobacteria bacterium]
MQRRPSATEQQLLTLFRQLCDADQQMLLSYAEFLQSRNCQVQAQVPDPKEIARPETESVIGAIKRLSLSFYMINRDDLLHETSELMTQHLMQGRDASAVIDDLEQLFQRHYRKLSAVTPHSSS